MEEQDLRVTLATLAPALAFTRSADFYNRHISRFGMRTVALVEEGPDEHLRNSLSFKLIKSSVDLAVIQLPTAIADASEHQRLGVERRVNSKNIEGNTRCGTIISATDDIAVTDEE